MRYHSLRWLFLSCFLGLMVGFDLLPYFSKSIEALALEPVEIKSPKFLPDSQNNCPVESRVDSVYAQAQSINNEDVANLAKRLDELDDMSGKERKDIIEKLASTKTEDALNILARAFTPARHYTYRSIIYNLGSKDPALLFLIAKKASKKSPATTSPVALFIPALTGDILRLEIQRRPKENDQEERLRFYSVAALAYADYDVTNELISLLSTPELFAALIEVISQTEMLWCDSRKEIKIRSTKILSFSNKVLQRIGPQYIPILTEVAKTNPDSESDVSSALPNLQKALNNSNLNGRCSGTGGSWAEIFAGVIKILKP